MKWFLLVLVIYGTLVFLRKMNIDGLFKERRPEPGPLPNQRPSSQTSPHTILGVGEDADFETITKAYKALVQQYHPDKVAHLGKDLQELAHERFTAIQRAYEALKEHHHQ